MLQAVLLVVDQMPSDAVVEVNKHKRQKGWHGGKHRSVTLSVQVTHVSEPGSSSSRLSLSDALVGPKCGAIGSAAFIRWLERIGNF